MSRLHETVVRTLLDEIVADEVPEGEWLPREVDLAARFRISRGVAREVVHALRLRGVIDVRHGRGAWVLPEERWNLLDADVLRAASLVPERHDLLEEVLECRRTVEADAAALAAERATADDLSQLAQAFEVLRAALAARRAGAATETARIEAEAHFHDRLVAAAGNRPLRRMLEPVHAALASARYVEVPDGLEATVRQHRRMLRALEAHDAGAAREALAAHVRELGRWLAKARRATS
jgi:GntR family galactonate operon transcriptional repressor